MSIDDPAWFYSSLAQTSAAIVGLIGGFLVSRLIDQRTVMQEKRTRLLSDVNSVWALFRNRRRQIEQARTFHAEAIKRADESSARGDATVRSLGDWHLVSGLTGQQRDLSPDACREGSHAALAGLDVVDQAWPELVGEITDNGLDDLAAALARSAKEVAADLEGEFTDASKRVKRLREDVLAFRAAVLPNGLLFVSLLVAWLAATGVVWPLSVLPGMESSSKFAMLSALVVGLLGLLAYIAHELFQLQKMKAFRWE